MLVVQSEGFNRSRLQTVVVVVLTTNLLLLDAPGNLLLPGASTGLLKDSVANVSQLATIDRDRLDGLAGKIGGQRMRAVESGLRLVLGL